ncbi:unnamed protein product [Lathyrus oleraceus]
MHQTSSCRLCIILQRGSGVATRTGSSASNYLIRPSYAALEDSESSSPVVLIVPSEAAQGFTESTNRLEIKILPDAFPARLFFCESTSR